MSISAGSTVKAIVIKVNDEWRLRIPQVHGPLSKKDLPSDLQDQFVEDEDLPTFEVCYPIGTVKGSMPTFADREIVIAYQLPGDNISNFLVIGTTGEKAPSSSYTESAHYFYTDSSGTIQHYKAPSGSADYVFPLPSPYNNSNYISSQFGYRINPVTGASEGHKGIDIAAPEGTPIYAAADGVVRLMHNPSQSGGYGNFVTVRHGLQDGHVVETRYGHMSKFGNVTTGTPVGPGNGNPIIGYVGSTGQSTGNHLHFEVVYGPKGQNFDYLGDWQNPLEWVPCTKKR